MCRSTAEGGRRCPCDNDARRRRRQRAAYALRRAAASSVTALTPPSPADPTPAASAGPTLEDCQVKVAQAAAAIQDAKGIVYQDANGWMQPTDPGLAAENAVRDAGRLLAARADELITPQLSELGTDPELLALAGEPARDRQHYAELVNARADAAVAARNAYFETHKDIDGWTPWEDKTYTTLRDDMTPLLDERGLLARDQSRWDEKEAQIYAEAHLQVLSEQRQMGPRDGQPLALANGSTKAAREAIHTATAYYPTDWIDRHNTLVAGKQRRQLLVTATSARAHYISETVATIKETRDVSEYKYVAADKKPPRNTDPNQPAPEVWVYRRHRYDWRKREAVPFGPLLEAHYSAEQIAAGEPERDGATRVRRYTTRSTKAMSTKAKVSRITVDSDPTWNGAGVSTAMHELGHHMDDMHPVHWELAEAHIAQRTTNPDGTREQLVGYLKETRRGPSHQGALLDSMRRGNEWVRPDGFISSYMGKPYPTASHATELFSTGMEGLFGGGYGKFAGSGTRYSRPDPEHRAFMLGLLASASRTTH